MPLAALQNIVINCAKFPVDPLLCQVSGKKLQKSEEWRFQFAILEAKVFRAETIMKCGSEKELWIGIVNDVKKVLNRFLSLSRGIHWEITVICDCLPRVYASIQQFRDAWFPSRGKKESIGNFFAQDVDWSTFLSKNGKYDPQLALARLLPDAYLAPYAIPLLLQWSNSPSSNGSDGCGSDGESLGDIPETSRDHVLYSEKRAGNSFHYSIDDVEVLEVVSRVIDLCESHNAEDRESRFKLKQNWSATLASKARVKFQHSLE